MTTRYTDTSKRTSVMTYTVKQWGRVYRSNGPTVGVQGVITGLSFQDVCDQIRAASRRTEGWIDIFDEQGHRKSLGLFQVV